LRESIKPHQTINPDVAVLEYEGTGKAVQTGRSYQQKYITVLTFREGRISHWKDYWNPMSVLSATGKSDSEEMLGEPFGCFPKGWLSRHCHASRGKTLENHEQKVSTEEKLTLALHRNCLILLGKLPLRQIVIKLLKWPLTECFMLQVVALRTTYGQLREGKQRS
jgi:hypothetical protein